MFPRILVAAVAASVAHGGAARAKEVHAVGISVGSLGNPGFVSIAKTAAAQLRKVNPGVTVTTVGYDYDLGRQFQEIDNFIASNVDFILLNPGDPKGISSAIKKAQDAGIPVVAFDTVGEGADAAVTTDNVQAGEIACQYIAEHLNGKGNVIIQNGPQVSSVIDRVNGCKKALGKHPDLKILSDDQDGKGSREGGLAVGLTYLTRFPKIDAVFCINDPQAIGVALAARQRSRSDFIITAVDGSPDMEAALKDPTFSMIKASASQDFYTMPKVAVQIGLGLMNGKKPERTLTLIPSNLVTRENVNEYKGWNSVHDD